MQDLCFFYLADLPADTNTAAAVMPANTDADTDIDAVVINSAAAGDLHKPELMNIFIGSFRSGIRIILTAHITAVIIKTSGFFQILDDIKCQGKSLFTGC